MEDAGEKAQITVYMSMFVCFRVYIDIQMIVGVYLFSAQESAATPHGMWQKQRCPVHCHLAAQGHGEGRALHARQGLNTVHILP